MLFQSWNAAVIADASEKGHAEHKEKPSLGDQQNAMQGSVLLNEIRLEISTG